MGWIHIDTNTVSAIGRLIFRKRERFEDFWTLSFTNRSDVMSAYAQNVTASNQPIVFTNNTSSANVGNIKIHIFEETYEGGGSVPVGNNFSWSSSGTNVNVAANGTYSYQGITHTSIADEFYYDGTSHGVYPYSGTLDGAHSYRIQFIYTDENGIEYLSDFYDFGSHYYYTQPFASFEQAIRGDVDLVFTASAPSETYSLGERVVGTLTATNTYPYACTLGLNAPNGVSLSQSTFEDVSPGATVSTTFSYVITEEDLYNESKTFNFGGSIGNVSMNPININGQTVSCTVDTDSVSPNLDITVIETSEPINGESYALGEHIEGTGTILNDGNVTLYNIIVTNEMCGDEWTIPELSPGQSSPFVWEYYVAEADIIAQQLEIQVTARGEDFVEDLWWFEGYCPCLVDDPNPSLYLQIEEISEPENGEYYVLGERIDYSFTVTNDGNITCDNQNTHFLCDLTANDWSLINNLEPNSFVTFTDSYSVTEEDILRGYVSCDFYANAYMADQEYYNFSSQDLESLVEDPYSEITGIITMDDEFSTYYDGQYVRNHIVITNAGNMTLTDIILTNEASGDEWTIWELKPGASQSFETEAEIIYNSSTDSSFITYEIEDAIDPEGNTYTTTIQKELPTEMEPSNPCELTITKHYQQIDGTYTVLGEIHTLNYGDTYKIPVDVGGFTASVNPVQGTLYEDTEVDVYYTRNYYPLTIYYKYEKNNTTAYQTYQQDYLYGANYSVESPIIPGYLPDKDAVEGKIWGGKTETVKYYFSNQYYRLIIRYYQLGLDGSYTLLTSGNYAPVTRFIEHGGTYNITSPSMTNYTPDPAIVSGILNEDKEINVYYDRPRHQLTIHYYMQQSDGTYVLDDNKTFSQWYWEGSSYNKTTESITGYTSDINQVRGTMGNQDIIMDVHYDLITYSFTAHYVTSNGPSAHPDITVTGTILDSDKYIISPAVEGYQAGTKYIRWRPGYNGSSQTIIYTAITSGVSWAEITDGNYVTTSTPYSFTVTTLIDGNPYYEDDQGIIELLPSFTIYVWSGCNVTVHWQGSSFVPSTWNSYNQEVSWNNGSGVYSKPYDNATDSFTITSNNNIYASTDFTEA